MEFDGFFEQDGKRIEYYITDRNTDRVHEGKMARGIIFFSNSDNLGYYAVYGKDEEMTNISSIDAKKWYNEMINGE